MFFNMAWSYEAQYQFNTNTLCHIDRSILLLTTLIHVWSFYSQYFWTLYICERQQPLVVSQMHILIVSQASKQMKMKLARFEQFQAICMPFEDISYFCESCRLARCSWSTKKLRFIAGDVMAGECGSKVNLPLLRMVLRNFCVSVGLQNIIRLKLEIIRYPAIQTPMKKKFPLYKNCFTTPTHSHDPKAKTIIQINFSHLAIDRKGFFISAQKNRLVRH